MLKTLERKSNKRPVHIISRSPNQYPNYKTSIDNKPTDKNKRSLVIFDNVLRARHKSPIDELFTRGRHEISDVYYISQSFFDLPRQSIRNNSDRIKLVEQTLGDVESMAKDIGVHDVEYGEIKDMCCKTWSEKITIYVLIGFDFKKKVNVVFSVKAKTYSECIPESEAF